MRRSSVVLLLPIQRLPIASPIQIRIVRISGKQLDTSALNCYSNTKQKGSGTMEIGCVILAAGNSFRFGDNKLLARYGGKALIEWVLDAVPAERLGPVCVVTQYPAVAALAEARGFSAVWNREPELGISHSVALGTGACCAGGAWSGCWSALRRSRTGSWQRLRRSTAATRRSSPQACSGSCRP